MSAFLLLLLACNQETSVAKRDPLLEAQPGLLDLGTVTVGSVLAAPITLAHVSGPEAVVAAVGVVNFDGEWFTYGGGLPSLSPGGSTTLELTYAPEEEGYHEAEVSITYNSESAPTLTVVVRGEAREGAARLRPGLLDFGAVDVGDDASLELEVLNEGLVDVTIDAVTFTSADFVLEDSLPLTVAAGDDASLTVTFTASSPVEVDEDLEVLLAGGVSGGRVVLRANDCAHGDPSVYDADDDGYTVCGGDCDDRDPGAYPGATETEDNSDEDCDGLLDEGTDAYDDDGDGWTDDEGDCNDGDPDVNPGRVEDVTNGIDDDCNGVVDYGTLDRDADGYAEAGGDCDDGDAFVYPGAPELADGQDNDCDGFADEGTTRVDDDLDGWSEDAGDCDDTDATVGPAEVELANGRDDDCDGRIDEGTNNADDDGDGFTESGGDCDDADAAVSPAAAEVPRNGIDDDCDGVTS